VARAYRVREVDGIARRDTLLELQRKTFPSDPADQPTEKELWWLLYHESKPVGFCSMKAFGDEPGVYLLMRAGILDGHTGKGLQRRLIRTRVQRAKDLGARILLTSTALDNPASSNNLAREGFKLYNPAYPWMAKGYLYWFKHP